MFDSIRQKLNGVNFDTERISKKFHAKFFDRISFYETFITMLETYPIRTALTNMLKVETDFGNEKGNVPLTLVLTDCINALDSGEKIGDILLEWVPLQESVIIHTSEMMGNITEGLSRACLMATSKTQIKDAIIRASMYPLILLMMCFVNMYMVRDRLLPELTRLVPKEKWSVSLTILTNVSNFFIGNWISLSLITLIITFLIIRSMPTYTGRFRKYLDLVPPWSIYRIFQGVGFLFNISSMLNINVDLEKSLRMLERHSDKWLFERLEETRKYVLMSQHLGKALKSTGYNFPSKKCVNQMALLTEGNSISTTLVRYAERWLDEAIKSIKRNSNWITGLTIVFIAGYILCLVLAIYGLQDAMHH